MWTIERFIKAGLLKEKDKPTMNGITFHQKVWIPHDCTINVYQDGYHEFLHYAYLTESGEIKFSTGRRDECVHNRYTQYLPVMADKTVDWFALYESALEPPKTKLPPPPTEYVGRRSKLEQPWWKKWIKALSN